MPISRNEIPTGLINGSNVDFTCSHAFIDGTLFPVIDGLMRRPDDDDGIIVVDADAGTFQTKEVLAVGQTLEVAYLDTTADPGQDVTGILEVEEIIGVVE